ncbi:MAG: serine/threonine protein kinase, partial [Isosphaeraceae bacterium]
PVGMLYGPSGGGKSSFAKAGLLPSLDRAKVRAIELEATADGTEARLLAAIRREFPAMPEDADLPLAIALMRDDPERRAPGKILLVLDQFEQAIQGQSIGPDSGLVRALQQCDGRRVAALLLVRDEFWMPLSRLMHAVGVPIVQGGNASAVELFDVEHARKVLEGFGRALGRIPEGEGRDAARAARFLDEALRDLADGEGRVIPIRLSLFIEVVRNRPWAPETLRGLGGVDGIGVKFLDDGFGRPEYRQDRDAAQRILERLLPSPTSLIRGNPAGRGELMAASGLADRPGEFDHLMRALAQDLRLIMEADGPGPDEPHYRLAHDYLVRPVRQWIERDQDASPAGRARRRLALITASWRERPGPHQLPSLLEWASILRNVPSRGWAPDERALMRAAARRFAAIAAMIVAASAIAAAGLLGMNRS